MKIKAKLASREIGGELYVVDIEGERLHSFNPAASFLWDCLKKGLTQEAAAARLAEEFEVSPEVAAEDTRELVKTLESRGLLTK